jgi:hypothetical protein
MHGSTSQLTPLAARKQLLVMESELNRAELIREWSSLREEALELAGDLTGDANALGSLASAGAALFTTGATLRRWLFKDNGAQKASWIQTLINGARTGISVWLALRPRAR